MAPKRRPPSAIGELKSLSSSSALPLYTDADVVVVSADNKAFALRALHLRSASSVFDNVLGLPTADDQDKADGLPLVNVEESSTELEVFLRYVQPDRLLVDGQIPKPEWPTMLMLSAMFAKYDSPGVARYLLGDQLPRFIGDPDRPSSTLRAKDTHGLQPFAVASIHGLEDVAKRALQWTGRLVKKKEGALCLSHDDPRDPEKLLYDRRHLSLGDLPPTLLQRIPPRVVLAFCQLHSRVVSEPHHSWLNAAADFKVRRIRRDSRRLLGLRLTLSSY